MSLAGSCPDNLGVGEMVQIALGGSQQRLRLHGVDCVSAITWVVAPNNVPNLIRTTWNALARVGLTALSVHSPLLEDSELKGPVQPARDLSCLGFLPACLPVLPHPGPDPPALLFQRSLGLLLPPQPLLAGDFLSAPTPPAAPESQPAAPPPLLPAGGSQRRLDLVGVGGKRQPEESLRA